MYSDSIVKSESTSETELELLPILRVQVKDEVPELDYNINVGDIYIKPESITEELDVKAEDFADDKEQESEIHPYSCNLCNFQSVSETDLIKHVRNHILEQNERSHHYRTVYNKSLKMEWTEKLSIKFIKKIQNYPCLWDPSHADRKNRNKVEDAFKIIAEEIGTDTATVRKKKEVIFQIYRKYKRKVARSKLSETQDVYKPSWILYALLDAFLHCVYTPKRTNDSLEEDKQSDVEESGTLDNEGDRGGDNSRVTDAITESSAISGQTVSPTALKVRKTGKTKEDTSYVNAALEQLVDINRQILQRCAKRNDEATPRDECSIYGELVAAKLSKMDDRRRQFAMHKMDNVLYEMSVGFPLHPEHQQEQATYPNPNTNTHFQNIQYNPHTLYPSRPSSVQSNNCPSNYSSGPSP